jgi:hypothetical protein
VMAISTWGKSLHEKKPVQAKARTPPVCRPSSAAEED